jgi:plasmid stabilization system protein ParE
VAEIVYREGARADLDRLAGFLLESGPAAAAATYELLIDAIRVLENHPLIGRPAEGGMRELVISRGKSGYLALYLYRESDNQAIVLAIRHQREAGYKP